jgi:putative spermidine/putrescine transport system substrate-binding protein
LDTLPRVFDAVAGGKKLGLQRGAKINLEMALLADGVKPDQVYALLATDAGVARAFAKLDSIKRNIVWWSGAEEAPSLLQNGRADITTMLTAQLEANAAGLAVLPVRFHEADVLGIPRGDPRKERAMAYIRYATASEPLANMAKFAPYTPPRRSSLELVAKLPASPSRDFVLAQKDAGFFAVDDAFWDAHGSALETRFRAWLSQP